MRRALLALGLAAFAGIAPAQSDPSAREVIAAQRSTDQQLHATFRQAAQSTVANAPVQVDRYTTLTSAMYLAEQKTIFYVGTINGRSTPEGEARAKRAARDAFCAVPANRAWLARGVTYRYQLNTLNGQMNYQFGWGDCDQVIG